MNLSFDKQKYVISGVDSVRAKKGIYNFEILSSDEIFPLKEIEFSGVKYPCPKNSDYYLEKIYGDYMDIPKVLRFHNRLNDLRKSPQLKEASIRYYNILKEVNDSF
ncbi:LicD family protein, partial [Methanobrevibacter sp.]|uniref:LicD family protein n=1 Tax=Methanobrevibacter sp. TaxID=66852 RepID=UPI00386A8C52